MSFLTRKLSLRCILRPHFVYRPANSRRSSVCSQVDTIELIALIFVFGDSSFNVILIWLGVLCHGSVNAQSFVIASL